MSPDTLKTILCPVCAGLGRSDRKKVCRSCHGWGLLGSFRSRFLYLSLPPISDFSPWARLTETLQKWLWRLTIFFFLLGLISWEVIYFGLLLFLFLIYYFLVGHRPTAVGKLIALPRADIVAFCTPGVFAILKRAQSFAYRAGKDEAGKEEVLVSLFLDAKTRSILLRLGVEMDQAPGLPVSKGGFWGRPSLLRFNHHIFELLLASLRETLSLGHPFIGREELLLGWLALYKDRSPLPSLRALSLGEARETVAWLHQNSKASRLSALWRFGPLGGMNRALTARPTPVLDQYSTDLTRLALEGRFLPLVGREKEIEEIVRVLSRSLKNNVLLLGEAGVGKTALVYGLAQRLTQTVPSPVLANKRLVALETGALLASGAPGGSQERCRRILSEIEESGNVILSIDTLEVLFAGDEAALSLSALLESALERKKLQLVGSSILSSYHQVLEKHPTLLRFFEVVKVAPMTPSEALVVLERNSPHFERRLGVRYSLPALEATIRFSVRYFHDRPLPDKAIDLLDEAGVFTVREGKRVVGADEVAAVVSEKTGIPVGKITEAETSKLLGLAQKLKNQVIGQNEAVEALAAAMQRGRVGLKELTRPIASFLFVGPTGVGKTELAKALSRVYFGSEKVMIRLDMSEYESENSISRLLGAPPGSEGANLGGQFTEAVRHSPFSLILLDEIEKAHPKIVNVFLQVLEDGRLTDSLGFVADFSNTILIATSNAVSPLIKTLCESGVTFDVLRERALSQLSSVFSPEFLNRFDGIIFFRPLSKETMGAVVRKLLSEVVDKLKMQEIELEFGEDLKSYLTDEGYDPVLGARPLRRLIDKLVEDPLSEKILRGELGAGDKIRYGLKNVPSAKRMIKGAIRKSERSVPREKKSRFGIRP